ncbi:MAG TPA: pitrilysin family protein [Pyrinomonadaceae bacterium]
MAGPLAVLLFFLAALPANCAAQAVPAPPAGAEQREQLLNGLLIVLVERPGEAQTVLRLRLHNGASFDLAGKDGLMALLGDALFPDPQTREYVTGDLEGRLSVSVGHDSIDVLLAGRADQFERLVELLRNAVVNTQLTPEVFGRVRDARVKIVRELGVSPGAVADDAISARLYGSYPYGRRVAGTPESLARVERGDLVQARERFLIPNNATLIVSGGFERRRALRALRQFLGVWRKGDQIVPPTFRQPEAVDPRPLVVDFPNLPDAEVRVAVRGVARSERDAATGAVLAELVRSRWLAAVPELKGRAVTVRHDARALDGAFLLGASVPTTSAAAQALEAARKVMESLAATAVPADELETAKKSVVAAFNKQAESGEQLADDMLDSQTYGTAQASMSEMARAAGSLTPADVQRVASKLFRVQAASVVVGDAARLRADLARLGEVETSGDATAKPTPKPAQASPFKSPTQRRP